MATRQRYLHIIATVNPAYGGPVEGIKQISAVTQSQGYRPEVATLDAPDAPYLSKFPLPVHPLGPGKTSYGYTPHLVPWLKRHLADYDGVILNGIWTYSSFGAYQALRSLRHPYIVFTHGMLDPYFKRFWLKHLKKSLYWPWGEYPVLRDAQAVCFTSEEERVLARTSFTPYRCHEAVVNYGTGGPTTGAQAEARQRAAFAELFPQVAERRFLLFLSRIHPKKGCDLLVDSFARIADQAPDLHLVIAGPDQLGWRQELEARAVNLGVAERIWWTGPLSGDAKWGAFLNAEAFILPSHQENFGIVIAEALACSTPVLTTDKVNIWREVVADGAGFVESDTAEGIYHLLSRWLETSAGARQEMRERARSCFLQRFEIGQAAESLLQVLFGARYQKVSDK